LERLPAGAPLAGVACLGAALVLALRRLLREAARSHGSLRAFLAAHAPLVKIYLAILAILLFGIVLGSGGFNLIILIHVTARLVFVHHLLRERPAPVRNPWNWLRHSATGFLVLHLAAALGILFLLAIRVHVWERVGFVSEMLASSSFPYWSLMHITMAFGRRS
jgi:hypothetical protein